MDMLIAARADVSIAGPLFLIFRLIPMVSPGYAQLEPIFDL